MQKKILEVDFASSLLQLFQSNNDAVKYCASQALLLLLMIHPGDPQPCIPASEVIAWLVRTVGHWWRYQRTVKFLSEIIKNGKATKL